jgi:hypothetical protein
MLYLGLIWKEAEKLHYGTSLAIPKPIGGERATMRVSWA